MRGRWILNSRRHVLLVRHFKRLYIAFCEISWKSRFYPSWLYYHQNFWNYELPEKTNQSLDTFKKCLFLSRLQIIIALTEINIIFLAGIVVLMSSWPVIAYGIGKYLTIGIECATSNWLLHGFRRFKFCSGIFVPEGETSIRSYSSKSSMNWMKCNVINSVDILKTICDSIWSMTFKGEVIFWILGIGILDSNSAFNASKGKT